MPENMREMIAEQLNVDVSEITLDPRCAEKVAQTDIELPADELSNIVTVEDVINYLRDKGVEL